MIFIISFLHIVILSLIDAIIKGNIVAYYNNDWARVPWYFKDENFIYPILVVGILFGLTSAIIVAGKSGWNWKYLVMLGVWILGGLESLSYWFWITVLKINQTMWWLPDDSLIWWYPREAPWLNIATYLKWFSGSVNVTREGVLLGVGLAAVINLIVYFLKKADEKVRDI